MRFMKFAVVGVTNTALSFVVFDLAALGLHMPAVWANVVAWLAGFINSFIWNRMWTFADRSTGPTGPLLVRFAAANGLALAVSTAIVVGLQRAAGVTSTATASALVLNGIEAVAIGAALVVNYVVSSRWVFRARTGARSRG
jgi:putative flippase GtrA